MTECLTPDIKGKIESSRVYPEFFPLSSIDRVANLGCGTGPQVIVYRGQYKEMVGVDINSERLEKALAHAGRYGITNFSTIHSNVEEVPLPDQSFDNVLAIDIIEHVQHPDRFVQEAGRLLKPGGALLITFPAMHDKYVHTLSATKSAVMRLVGRGTHSHAHHEPEKWDPDDHNQEFPLADWIRIVESAGFRLVRSRASTLFPPLHLYGVPRFWYTIEPIHWVDSRLCALPGLKRLGQSLVCVFTA